MVDIPISMHRRALVGRRPFRHSFARFEKGGAYPVAEASKRAEAVEKTPFASGSGKIGGVHPATTIRIVDDFDIPYQNEAKNDHGYPKPSGKGSDIEGDRFAREDRMATMRTPFFHRRCPALK